MDRLAFRLLIIVALTARGLEINPNRKILEKAEGENVSLACHFTLAPEDTGNLEIEWSVKSIRHPLDTAEFLLYTAGHIYDTLYEPLKGRVYFDSEDPEKGNAAIHLLLLTTKDTGVYYCQVKKVVGIRRIYTVLRVLKPPSKPSCNYTEGGQTKVLRCRSQEGAAPIQYHWSRLPPWKLLPKSALLDKTAGTLTIHEANEGTYKCTAINRVGKKECFLELNLPRPPSVTMIAGAVTGGLVAIMIIASITYLIVRRVWCLRHPPEAETPNEILEDASPPQHTTRSVSPTSHAGAGRLRTIETSM
ncbi:coxsackievirus and adenovirus receptor homolog [Pleuronectes platessa]|uniref:coxsackievirus and adenovirus receptor homolog n=1 Tax=Pleuronectes platessa TaxID=8262 RepID=UPI00232A0F91|nr:coxsackievirus and adenovirus receptor homolog [Pleuronectes platessa]